MKRLLAAGAVLLVTGCWISSEVKATQPGNPLSTCTQFANSRYRANHAEHFEKITLFPKDIVVEKLEGKMGSQYISTVLSGNGVLKLKKTEPLDIQFTCLMENNRKAVFFHANPRTVSSASITSDPQTRAAACVDEDAKAAIPCLQKTLKQEEKTLGDLEKGVKGQGNRHAKQLLGLSGTQWKQYRDTECLRRTAFQADNGHPGITEYECRIGKTQERIADLHFNR